LFFFKNHQNFQIYSLFLIKLLTEHTGKLTDFRLKLAICKAKNWLVWVLFLDFRYSLISDTQNWYKNITFFSNFKTRKNKIKLDFNQKFDFLNGMQCLTEHRQEGVKWWERLKIVANQEKLFILKGNNIKLFGALIYVATYTFWHLTQGCQVQKN